MENLNKLTKQELIALATSQKHLAEAVEQKDMEIIRYQESLKLLEKELKESKTLQDKVKQLESVVDSLTIKNKALTDRNKELSTDLAQLTSADVNVEDLKNKHEKAIFLLDHYMGAYRNLLMTLQGTLDQSISLDGLLRATLK